MNKNKELYVVYFESANYCGQGEHCLVWAKSEDDARDEASEYAENYYREQDEEQFIEEYGDEEVDDVTWASIISAYPLSSEEAADVRKYLLDDTQKSFYPIVN